MQFCCDILYMLRRVTVQPRANSKVVLQRPWIILWQRTKSNMSLRRSNDSRSETLRCWRYVKFWRPDNFLVKFLSTLLCQQYYSYILQIIYVISEENKLLLSYPPQTVNFWQSHLKNKKVDVFWDTVYFLTGGLRWKAPKTGFSFIPTPPIHA